MELVVAESTYQLKIDPTVQVVSGHIATVMRITLTYLEFYSGIGGWGYAVEHACRSLVKECVASSPSTTSTSSLEADDFHLRSRLLAAYDHSDLANSVFYHNHRMFSNGNGVSCSDSSQSLPKKNNENNSKKTKYSNERRCNNRPRQTPIERLTVEELQCHSADVWCMSPPCQPHTRQHSNQHMESEDARSKSFLHLCKMLCDMEENSLPKLILLENVVGFEKEQSVCIDGGRTNDNPEHDASSVEHHSAESSSPINQTQQKIQSSREHECNNDSVGSFQSLRRALSRRNYHVGHFHLDPTHVGLPNNRPRHYTVAFRRHEQFRPGVGHTENEATADRDEQSTHNTFSNSGLQREPDGELTRQLSLIRSRYKHLFSHELQLDQRPIIYDENALSDIEGLPPPLPPLNSFLDHDLPPHVEYSALSTKQKSLQIPAKIQASSSAWCFDIATPNNSCIASCFTHSYGKFVRGTGSILYTGPPILLEGKYDISASTDYTSNHRFQLKPPEERVYDAAWSKDLDWDHHLRYFSGNEIARLMGFPVAELSASAAYKGIDAGVSSPFSDANTVDSLDTSFRRFSFPPECAMKQQWKLLGNSLNVRVAAIVAEIGIQSILNDLHTETIQKEIGCRVSTQ